MLREKRLEEVLVDSLADVFRNLLLVSKSRTLPAACLY
jgi:hypothetical protein